MPYSMTADPTYQVVSGRDGVRTVLAETTFPEGTFEHWGYDSPSTGPDLNGFGSVTVNYLIEKWREQEDLSQAAVLTAEDLPTLINRGMERITVYRDGVSRAPREDECRERFEPLVGTTHRG